MSSKTTLSRRTVLRCAGIAGLAIALPPLEAMVKAPGVFYGGASGQPLAAPRKLILFHWPQGVPSGGWSLDSPSNTFFPRSAGTDLAQLLTPCLQPLERHVGRINLLSGLTYRDVDVPVLAHGGCVGLMTGYRNFEMPGRNLSAAAGPSVDHVAATRIGQQTPVPTLTTVLYSDRGEASPMSWTRGTSLDDPNYASAVHRALWDPLEVYGRAFQPFAQGDPAAAEAAARVHRRQQSLLDFARADIERLRMRIGRPDQERLAAHLETFRAIERKIQAIPVSCNDASGFAGQGKAYNAYLDEEAPAYAKLMMDMHLLALRCDITNVSFYSMGPTGTDRVYPFADVHIPHHCIAHSGEGCPEVQGSQRDEVYTRVVRWYMGQLALFLDGLAEVDGTGTSLLDRSAFVAFSEFADGGLHYSNYTPMIVAGKAGRSGADTMTTGKQLCFRNVVGVDWQESAWLVSLPGRANRSPIEVWDSALKAVGALSENEKFGDPANMTEPLPGLWV